MARHPDFPKGVDSPVVFSDFDGTITNLDVTDAILNQFAYPSWREIEKEWVAGTIGSRECLERQMALVQASQAELDKLIDSIPIDPGFVSFARFLRSHKVPFSIVSDGFDYVITRVLRRAGLARGFAAGENLFSSSLRFAEKRLLTSFGDSARPCEHGCATCKARVLRSRGANRGSVFFIGDGLSDRFAAREADLVFAKRELLAYCRENGIRCEAFETFDDIKESMSRILGPAPKGSRRALAVV